MEFFWFQIVRFVIEALWVLFCGCGLIFLGSCGLILVVVVVVGVDCGQGGGDGLYEVVVAIVVGYVILL